MAEIVETYSVASRGIGLPDYSASAPLGQIPTGPTYSSADVAELAVRLKSVDIFDRRGTVVWLDDFESDVRKWVRTNAVWSAVMSDQGSFSCQMVMEAAAFSAEIGRPLPPFMRGNIAGAEIAFCIPDDAYMEFTFYYNINLIRYFAHVVINNWNAYIVSPAGNLIPAITDIYLSPQIFHHVKLVADFSTNRYIRLLLDNEEVKLTNYSLYQVVSAHTRPYGYLWIHTATAALDRRAYIDNVILTENEPLEAE